MLLVVNIKICVTTCFKKPFWLKLLLDSCHLDADGSPPVRVRFPHAAQGVLLWEQALGANFLNKLSPPKTGLNQSCCDVHNEA